MILWKLETTAHPKSFSHEFCIVERNHTHMVPRFGIFLSQITIISFLGLSLQRNEANQNAVPIYWFWAVHMHEWPHLVGSDPLFPFPMPPVLGIHPAHVSRTFCCSFSCFWSLSIFQGHNTFGQLLHSFPLWLHECLGWCRSQRGNVMRADACLNAQKYVFGSIDILKSSRLFDLMQVRKKKFRSAAEWCFFISFLLN